MNTSSRRNFLKALGGATALASFPAILNAATSGPRVIVVGGGFAGATAAKYLKHWSPVTLVEPKAKYQSPIMSNLVLNGQLSMDQLTFSYDTLAQKHGVNVVTDWVSEVDGVTQKVTLGSGDVLEYDRLILAPGITFNPVEGHDLDKVLHAWQSGEQVTMLQQQLEAMPAGGTFVMSIPAAPFRCPPGPYERACVIADYLKTNKPGSKVIVLDANADILVEKEVFGHAFDVTYAGIVEYHKEVVLTGVDSDQLIVSTETMEDIKADVLNIIPEQSAGAIIKSAGLITVADRWAGVNALSYESTAVNNIHIIGDSQGTGQPKAGHIANAEAKVCADAVIRLLNGGEPYTAPITNSACYSPVSADTATWLTAVYGYDSATDSMQKVAGSGGSAPEASKNNYEEMFVWSKSLFGDTFS